MGFIYVCKHGGWLLHFNGNCDEEGGLHMAVAGVLILLWMATIANEL